MSIINLAFIFILYFINQVYFTFHSSIISYVNQHDYLLDNNKQFVQINFSNFDNLFLFFNLISILFFFLLKFFLLKKLKKIDLNTSLNFLLLIFISIFFL